jgi:hypothetical protein
LKGDRKNVQVKSEIRRVSWQQYITMSAADASGVQGVIRSSAGEEGVAFFESGSARDIAALPKMEISRYLRMGTAAQSWQGRVSIPSGSAELFN